MPKFSLSCVLASAEHLIEVEGQSIVTFIGLGEKELLALGEAIGAAYNRARAALAPAETPAPALTAPASVPAPTAPASAPATSEDPPPPSA